MLYFNLVINLSLIIFALLIFFYKPVELLVLNHLKKIFIGIILITFIEANFIDINFNIISGYLFNFLMIYIIKISINIKNEYD